MFSENSRKTHKNARYLGGSRRTKEGEEVEKGKKGKFQDASFKFRLDGTRNPKLVTLDSKLAGEEGKFQGASFKLRLDGTRNRKLGTRNLSSSLRFYGRFLGRAGVFSGTIFSVFFISVRIAFASVFIGWLSGATSTKCWR